MDFISSNWRSGALGKVFKVPAPPPPRQGFPSEFPVVRIAGSWQKDFQNGDDCDKKWQWNGAILSLVDVLPTWRDHNEPPNTGYMSFICIPDEEEYGMSRSVAAFSQIFVTETDRDLR